MGSCCSILCLVAQSSFVLNFALSTFFPFSTPSQLV
jgi:hypothetical protein